MPTPNVTCSGPGPHVPASGILGTTDKPGADVRCASPACAKPIDPAIINQASLQSKAQAGIAANLAYLAIGSPANAQVVAQVRALTQQVQALIRLQLAAFDSDN